MKYDIRFCKCGTIHATDEKIIKDALDKDLNTVLICANCGSAIVIGADIRPDYFEPEKTCFDMYSWDLCTYGTLTIDEEYFKSENNSNKMKPVSKIIYSHGYRVPMKTGNYADSYFDGKFADMWYPDFWKIQRKDITVPEIMKFIDDFTKERTTVNMERFIYETPDDVLEDVSKYHIKGFNWKGTKYATDWNVPVSESEDPLNDGTYDEEDKAVSIEVKYIEDEDDPLIKERIEKQYKNTPEKLRETETVSGSIFSDNPEETMKNIDKFLQAVNK